MEDPLSTNLTSGHAAVFRPSDARFDNAGDIHSGRTDSELAQKNFEDVDVIFKCSDISCSIECQRAILTVNGYLSCIDQFLQANHNKMATEEHAMWDDLNIEYEHAYRNNPYKQRCVEEVIKLLNPGSRVLDIGCGTGAPVAKMLADAGMDVVGSDVAPQMVKLAQQSVAGTFEVADMVEYQPEGTFDAELIIFSQLGLTYADFHKSVYRLAKALGPSGLLVIGQAPAEQIVPLQDPAWDETRSYVEGYNLPFWGQPFPTLMFSRSGQRAFLASMGFTILYDKMDIFQPDNAKCAPETQQYIIARRHQDEMVKEPAPMPKSKGMTASG